MTNERKNEICDLLIEKINSGLNVYFLCILLKKIKVERKITVLEAFEFGVFMQKYKPKDAGTRIWWDGFEKRKRINFIKLLKTREWTQ